MFCSASLNLASASASSILPHSLIQIQMTQTINSTNTTCRCMNQVSESQLSEPRLSKESIQCQQYSAGCGSSSSMPTNVSLYSCGTSRCANFGEEKRHLIARLWHSFVAAKSRRHIRMWPRRKPSTVPHFSTTSVKYAFNLLSQTARYTWCAKNGLFLEGCKSCIRRCTLCPNKVVQQTHFDNFVSS